MFHSRQFRAPVMSPFFRPHKPFMDITLDNVRPPFHPPRYPTDGDSNSDTQLTPTISVESDPSESSYPTYSMESYHSKPPRPSVIRLSSDSSASLADPIPPLVHNCGFICTHVIPRERGRAWGGGRGDNAPGSFRNGYLPFDGWFGWHMLSLSKMIVLYVTPIYFIALLVWVSDVWHYMFMIRAWLLVFKMVYLLLFKKKIYPYFQYKVISNSNVSFASKSNN